MFAIRFGLLVRVGLLLGFGCFCCFIDSLGLGGFVSYGCAVLPRLFDFSFILLFIYWVGLVGGSCLRFVGLDGDWFWFGFFGCCLVVLGVFWCYDCLGGFLRW